jgi:hypothetical protein
MSMIAWPIGRMLPRLRDQDCSSLSRIVEGTGYRFTGSQTNR